MADKVGRDELTLALELATSTEHEGTSSGALANDQAEQIAREVGIPVDEFRRALAEARSARLGRGQWLGPSALQSAEASLLGAATARGAARAIAEGQAGLPQIAEGATETAPGIWRSSARGSLLQITSNRTGTPISAAANRALFKATTIVGTTGVGGLIGSQLGGLLTSGIMGEVSSTVAVGIAVGAVGGLVSGFTAGVSLWKASSRAFQTRLYQAVDRMRDTLASETDEGFVHRPDMETPRSGDA